jgi:hypothetical protein
LSQVASLILSRKQNRQRREHPYSRSGSDLGVAAFADAAVTMSSAHFADQNLHPTGGQECGALKKNQ